jgi:hypothetical protein
MLRKVPTGRPELGPETRHRRMYFVIVVVGRGCVELGSLEKDNFWFEGG